MSIAEEQVSRALIYLKKVGLQSEQKLDEHLPPESSTPQSLHKAMRYSIFAGGKRLRPGLAVAAFQTFNGKGDAIYFATSALEMLHTFSLIHDDLPCMDDDDFRRGRPTAHKVFGEAAAVLSGDALCIHAFEILSRTGIPETITTLAGALGTSGMLGGQMVDIESEGKTVDLETVNYIHYHKTAALIQASLILGAQIAHADVKKQEIISDFGKNIGLAFQVVDDILDIEQTTEQLGKDAGSDIERGKATYPSLIGIEASKQKAIELYESAVQILDQLKEDTSILRDIARFIITRVN
jgi:geranylgeranyl diphosphate synthase type II